MDKETEIKINKISNYLLAYATLIVLKLIYDVVDGDIENIRHFIRGGIRAAAAIYIALTIWELKKSYWWAIVLASGFFLFAGGAGLVMIFAAGVFYQHYSILSFVLLMLPALGLLAKIFFLTIQKDVKVQFEK